MNPMNRSANIPEVFHALKARGVRYKKGGKTKRYYPTLLIHEYTPPKPPFLAMLNGSHEIVVVAEAMPSKTKRYIIIDSLSRLEYRTVNEDRLSSFYTIK